MEWIGRSTDSPVDSLYNGINRYKQKPSVLLQPLTITIPTPRDLTGVEIQGLRSLVKGLLPKLLPFEIDSVSLQQYESPDLLEFTPFIRVSSRYSGPQLWTQTNDISGTALYDAQLPVSDDDTLLYPIYVTDSTISRIAAEMNLSSLVGYDVLSDSMLVWPAVEKTAQTSNLPSNLSFWNGLALIPADHSLEQDVVDNITTHIGKMADDGFISIPLTNFDDDKSLLNSLIDMYDLNVASRTTIAITLQAKEDWLNQAIQDIRGEMLPTINVQGDWTYLLAPTADTIAKLQYLAEVTYSRLALEEPVLVYGLSNINVMPDLTISLPLPTSQLVARFKDEFNQSLSLFNNLRAYGAPSLEEAFSRRLLASRLGTTQPTLIVRTGQAIYVVSDSLLSDPTSADLKSSLQFLQGMCLEEVNSFNEFTNVFGSPSSPCYVGVKQLPSLVVNDLALRGIFSFGELNGVITKLPSLPTIEEGQLTAITDDKEITYIASGDRWSSDLLTIDVRYQSDNLLDSIQRKYEDGFFLSPWGLAYYIYRKKLSPISFRYIESIATANIDPDLAISILGS